MLMTRVRPALRFVPQAATLCLLCLTTAGTAWAERPKIGLVLGGGGARGVAHVGVLKVVERERIPVDFVVGTSMGAIVGALFASGYSASEIESILYDIDWQVALSDRGPRSQHSIRSKIDDVEFSLGVEAGIGGGGLKLPSGLLQGQQLELLLRRYLAPVSDVRDFDRLPIPFRAVATDLALMRPHVFDSGDIPTAVRASMSVPGAFEPVRIDDKVLVDGGIVDNVPADVARSMGADVLIVVDVRTSLRSASELDSIGAVLNQVISGMMLAETDRELAGIGESDVLIHPDLGDLRSTDFPRSTDAIPLGEEAALRHLDELRKHAVTQSEYEALQLRRNRSSDGEPFIGEVEVVHAESGTRREAEALLAWQVGEPFDAERVESSISSLYSDGSYSRIQYEILQSDSRNVLSVTPIDKPWGPTIVESALRVSDDFDGDSNYLLSLQTTTNDVNKHGAKWVNRLRLGIRTGLFSEFLQPVFPSRRTFVSASAEYAGRNLSLRTPAERSLWRDRRALLALDIGRNISGNAELRLGYEFGRAETAPEFGDLSAVEQGDFTISQLSLEYVRDTLDDSGFPQEGSFVDIKLNQPVESLGSDTKAPAYFIDAYKPLSVGRGTFLAGLSASGVEDDGLLFQEIITLGGHTRLSGYQPDELFGRYAGLASIVYYRRFGGGEARLFGTPLYLGASVEAGNVWAISDDIEVDSLIYAGSMFAGIDSPIGPLYLAYGQAEGGVSSLYLSVGSLFRRLPRR